MSSKVTSLYKSDKAGGSRVWKTWTEGPVWYTEYGTLDGKMSTNKKKCIPKNEGKSNEKNASEQAIAEMQADIKKRIEDGYSVSLKEIGETISLETCFTTGELPSSFAPCKPINKCPEGTSPDNSSADLRKNLSEYYAQRKRNGHCVIALVSNKGVPRLYSRGMEDINHVGMCVPSIAQAIGKIPQSSLVVFEVSFIHNGPGGTNGSESPKTVASVIRTKDPKKVTERYAEFSQKGKFWCHALDAFYWNGEPIYQENHKKRLHQLNVAGLIHDLIKEDWYDKLNEFKKMGWEGLILRKDDDSSHLEFSFDGKPNRAGSWKFKFLQTDDFLIVSAKLGSSGKHTKVYASFEIAQYLEDGTLKSFGSVGPGTQSHEELETLTKKLKSGEIKFPFGVEIEFLARLEETGKVQFGQIQRIRTKEDKPYSEYTYNE